MVNLKTARQIYEEDKRVHLAVDIVAAMAAFRGGHFFQAREPHIRPETWQVQTLDTELEKVAQDLVRSQILGIRS